MTRFPTIVASFAFGVILTVALCCRPSTSAAAGVEPAPSRRMVIL